MTALSGSGRARPIGEARTGATSAACSGERSSLETSSRSRGEPVRDRDADLGLEHRDETVELGAAAGHQDPRHRAAGRAARRSTGSSSGSRRPARACSAGRSARPPGSGRSSSPKRYLRVSASTIGTSREAEMAAVVALPPEPMVRTNWGRPALVDDDHGEPGADGDDRLGLARAGLPSVPDVRRGRCRRWPGPAPRRSGRRPRRSGRPPRPTSMTPLTRSTWAAATRTRRILAPSSLV